VETVPNERDACATGCRVERGAHPGRVRTALSRHQYGLAKLREELEAHEQGVFFMSTHEERRERQRRFLRRNIFWLVPLGLLAGIGMFIGPGFLVVRLWRETGPEARSVGAESKA
jgi:hypothetical protein